MPSLAAALATFFHSSPFSFLPTAPRERGQKDFDAAAGERIQTGFDEVGEGLLDGHLPCLAISTISTAVNALTCTPVWILSPSLRGLDSIW